MSKPIARVVFSALITLALVVGIYSSVQGAAVKTGTKSAQAYISASVNLGPNSSRTSVQGQNSSGAQTNNQNQSGHHCHSDATNNPSDY